MLWNEPNNLSHWDYELDPDWHAIAEQNIALLEGRVDRIIGMHAGQLKGEASAAALAIHDYGRG